MKIKLIAIIATAIFFTCAITGAALAVQNGKGKVVEKFQKENKWIDVLVSQNKRVATEWEPAIGVVISWELSVPHSLLQEIAKNDVIYLMVENEADKAEAQTKMREWDIPEARVKYFFAEQGHSYVNSRDWASFSVFDKAGDFRFYDGVYLYPMGNLNNEIVSWVEDGEYSPDDEAFEDISRSLGIRRTDLDISLTGGNLFFDGLGKVFATELYTKENEALGYPLNELQKTLKEHFSINQYLEVSNYEDLGIQHIDVLMMMLDEERFIVKRVPKNHSSYERIEEIAKSLSQKINSFGRPYKVLRIDTPRYQNDDLANYTNSLILNKNIYVPLFNIPGDAAALKTWREAMPGYTVKGFQYTGNDIEYGWNFTDSLHCRTKQIHDPEMLHMVHKHIDASVKTKDQYEILVYIRDYSEAGLVLEDLKLNWRIKGDKQWTTILLDNMDRDYVFSSAIKGASEGQTVEYYISAADYSGRNATLPITAPQNLYTFTIDNLSENQAQ